LSKKFGTSILEEQEPEVIVIHSRRRSDRANKTPQNQKVKEEVKENFKNKSENLKKKSKIVKRDKKEKKGKKDIKKQI